MQNTRRDIFLVFKCLVITTQVVDSLSKYTKRAMLNILDTAYSEIYVVRVCKTSLNATVRDSDRRTDIGHRCVGPDFVTRL